LTSEASACNQWTNVPHNLQRAQFTRRQLLTLQLQARTQPSTLSRQLIR